MPTRRAAAREPGAVRSPGVATRERYVCRVSKTRLVGVDCACNPRDVGLAAGWMHDDGRLTVDAARGARTEAEIVEWMADAVAEQPTACLVGLDAPLGWPAALGDALASHTAGWPIEASANQLARRATDDRVAAAVGKRPLDVGADRIARTAHAALTLLERVRAATAAAIELAWTPGTPPRGIEALEVYPGGTLAARRLATRGYKRGDGAADARAALLDSLAAEWDLPAALQPALVASDHVFDAALCLLSLGDYARNDVLVPDDPERARREGWIWVKRPVQGG